MDIEALRPVRRELRESRSRIARRGSHHTRTLLIRHQIHHLHVSLAGVKNLEGVLQDAPADRLDIAVPLLGVLIDHTDTAAGQDIMELAEQQVLPSFIECLH